MSSAPTSLSRFLALVYFLSSPFPWGEIFLLCLFHLSFAARLTVCFSGYDCPLTGSRLRLPQIDGNGVVCTAQLLTSRTWHPVTPPLLPRLPHTKAASWKLTLCVGGMVLEEVLARTSPHIPKGLLAKHRLSNPSASLGW